MKGITVVLTACVVSIAAPSPADDSALSNRGTQQNAPAVLRQVSNVANTWHLVQETPTDRLLLTANECFFPSLGLTATGAGAATDADSLNGGKSFARIEGWDPGDAAEWGICLKTSGKVQARVVMSEGVAGQFTLSVGDKSHSFETKAGRGEREVVLSETFDVSDANRTQIKLLCKRAKPGVVFHSIQLSGEAVRGAAVIRKRWRPAAAHTKFSSSKAPDNIRLWVMEMDAVPGDLGFYCPITTPFGYYGPTWKADGTVNFSFNFSLWSYGRGKKEPPIEQLSHLLAIGNRDAKFSGFGHEGTGVKIRGWEPLAGRTGQRQAIALRVEPGPKYDTYYSYYFLTDEKRWRLFGVGNKFNNGKPLKSLWVGSFVEVPGPPHVQRTGPYERTMRYRGWVMDEHENWFPLDRMKRGNVDRQTGLTHTDRGVADDGWFYLQTGGWTFRRASKDGFVELPALNVHEKPAYLSGESVSFLKSVPSEITIMNAKRAGESVQGTFNVKNAGRNATVTVYWGKNDALTFADRWQHHKVLFGIEDGKNSFEIDDIGVTESAFIRLLLTNDDGQFWIPETTIR